MPATSAQQTGRRGEQAAVEHLRRNGYTIVTRNWRCPYGEIDIVAQKGELLVFIEVRARHTTTTEPTFESVTPRKRERMTKSAYAYLSQQGLPSDEGWRIDVIGVALPRDGPPVIDHVEDALAW